MGVRGRGKLLYGKHPESYLESCPVPPSRRRQVNRTRAVDECARQWPPSQALKRPPAPTQDSTATKVMAVCFCRKEPC